MISGGRASNSPTGPFVIHTPRRNARVPSIDDVEVTASWLCSSLRSCARHPRHPLRERLSMATKCTGCGELIVRGWQCSQCHPSGRGARRKSSPAAKARRLARRAEQRAASAAVAAEQGLVTP